MPDMDAKNQLRTSNKVESLGRQPFPTSGTVFDGLEMNTSIGGYLNSGKCSQKKRVSGPQVCRRDTKKLAGNGRHREVLIL